MLVVGVRKLKNQLSEYLRLVASGEVVLVTDRDQVVAELIAPRAGRAEHVADAQLADLAKTGRLTLPLVHDVRSPRAKPVADTATILSELEADRGDR